MKFREFYICNNDGKSNCVVRSLCRILNRDYDTVYNELCDVAKELNCNSFNDVEVFETYMKRNNILSINYGKDIRIKDLDLEKGEYIVFCWDKKDFYHMVSIIDNILYDKDDMSLDLYVISVYMIQQ